MRIHAKEFMMKSKNTHSGLDINVESVSISRKPLVSIVMPLYNCETFVLDALKSVVQQSCPNWELIIVDDRSTDNSYDVVKKFVAGEPRIKLHQLPSNSGAAAARNYAIELAQGRYIAFLDSDDLWLSSKLEEQVAFMKKKNVPLSFTGYQWIDEIGHIVKTEIHVPQSVTYEKLLKQNVIGCLTAMYDSSKIGKFYFDISLAKHEDYQYWLEILKTISYAEGLDISLAYYRIRQNSLSRNKISAATYVWKILRKYQKLSLCKAIYYFGWYTYKSILKYKK